MKKQHLKSYIKNHQNRFLQELFQFLRIPSISTEKLNKADVLDAAYFVLSRLKEVGIDQSQLLQTEGHPIVFGEKFVSAELPTVLIYGHYDVQPPDPLELWDSLPFEPEIRDGKIYARGACDDKGQMYMHIKALEYMNATQDFPCNLKFLFEGEEEIGSKNLPAFIDEHKDLLECDLVLISDTAMLSTETPSVITGLKGIALFELEVTGPARDLHSGIYGGAVANPINKLCAMIEKLHDENGRIAIPGFYDDVKELTNFELEQLAKTPFSKAQFLEDTGALVEHGEQGFSTLERQGFRPTLDVNGIWGGYTGEGAKTVLPSKAFAKISMRLVPGQTQAKIAEQFTSYIHEIAPEEVHVKVTAIPGCEPALTAIDGIGFKAASSAIEATFGVPAIPTRMGGSIPIVPMFKEKLGVETVLIGFGLDTDNLHSPNEHFAVDRFLKGIETLPLFLDYYAGMKLAEESNSKILANTL